MYAPGFVRGMLMHYSIVMVGYLLLLAPVRALMKLFVFKPGDGPDTKKTKEEVVELQAIGKPVPVNKEKKQVLGKLTYHGSMYYCKLYPQPSLHWIGISKNHHFYSDSYVPRRSSSHNVGRGRVCQIDRRDLYASMSWGEVRQPAAKCWY